MKKIFQFLIEEDFYKKRLDKFICEEVTAVSRMYLRYLIKEGKCSVNDTVEIGGYHLKKGDLIEMEVEIIAETAIVAEAIPLEIVFEDADILVVNKPPEMLVHPTRGVRNGTLLNALTHHFNFSELANAAEKFVHAGLVHRLDRKTSGLLLVSKNANSHRLLSNHFQRKLVEKRYFAVVEGVVSEDFGTINAPIGRNAEEGFWCVTPDGKSAESRFEVIERFADATLLSLEPITGRTNQLRLHCTFINHPIIGDDKYGGRDFERLCLHAYKLGFHHPTSGQRLDFQTALPADFIKPHKETPTNDE